MKHLPVVWLSAWKAQENFHSHCFGNEYIEPLCAIETDTGTSDLSVECGLVFKGHAALQNGYLCVNSSESNINMAKDPKLSFV